MAAHEHETHVLEERNDLLSFEVKVPEHVVALPLDERWLLVDTQRGVIHVLNPTASYLWSLLQEGRTGPELLECWRARYRLSPATAREDVVAFLRLLHRWGVLHLEMRE